MKKKVGIMCLLVICLSFVAYEYLKDDKKEEKKEDVYLKTVVFKDRDNDLIPVSINFHSQVEQEQEIMNRIDLMKSNQLERYGLYPVFDSRFEILSLKKEDKTMVLDMNQYIGSKGNDLNVLEALTFVVTDYDDIKNLKLQINGKDVQTLPDSQLPLTSLTYELGLNNFIETSNILHETIPVMAYNEKVINQYSYYIPTTLRIDENADVFQQVRTVLNHVSSEIQVVNASLKDGKLLVELGSNILLDNETLDKTLEDLIVLSLSTLEEVKDVKIRINQDEVRTKKASQIQFNYIKI